jgi:hypothetical protein
VTGTSIRGASPQRRRKRHGNRPGNRKTSKKRKPGDALTATRPGTGELLARHAPCAAKTGRKVVARDHRQESVKLRSAAGVLLHRSSETLTTLTPSLTNNEHLHAVLARHAIAVFDEQHRPVHEHSAC